jgi:hypothetical protein
VSKEPGTTLESRASELFNDSVEQLDGATLSRLNQGRHKALAELQKPAIVRWGRWAPALGVAAAATVAVVIMNGQPLVDVAAGPVTATDFEMLIEADSLEMLEDLEFFSLLDAVDAETNGNVG